MSANLITQPGKQCSAILVSGKLFNNGDGQFYLTHAKHVSDMPSRSSAVSGHRYTFLMVGQTNAKNMPRQHSLIIAQMTPNWLKVL